MRSSFLLAATIMLLLSLTVASAQDDGVDAAGSDAPLLKVWLPAPLISDETGTAYQLLSEHTAEFAANNNIDAAYRVKDVGKNRRHRGVHSGRKRSRARSLARRRADSTAGL